MTDYIVQRGACFIRNRKTLELTSDVTEAERMSLDVANEIIRQTDARGFNSMTDYIVQCGAGFIRKRKTLELTSDVTEAERMPLDVANETIRQMDARGFTGKAIFVTELKPHGASYETNIMP